VTLALTGDSRAGRARRDRRAAGRWTTRVEVVRGFDRPNIHLSVELYTDDAHKVRALVECVVEGERPAIVYAATRRRSEELAGDLRAAGLTALPYHAGRAQARARRHADGVHDR
jgi:ATP-dependent DNA helicase RecQ